MGFQVDFIDNTSQNQNKHDIIKSDDSEFIIDDYFVYVGSDRFENTLPLTQIEPFQNITEASPDGTTTTTETGDFKESIEALFPLFGIRTTGSRILLGICILVLFTVIMIMGISIVKFCIGLKNNYV